MTKIQNDVVIQVKELKKTYKNLTAVNDIHLEVKRGEIFGLLGHNGAGKTTTMECMLGTKVADHGSISILGMNPTEQRKKLFEKVGVQFQDSTYQDKIKVKEICQVTASLYSNPLDWGKLLKDFSLGDKKNSFVADLSGGEKQKLSVLLAFLHDPDIVFLDELTTGLDPKARREIWTYIKLLQNKGVTIFLTSHYMDEVEYLCDRICILNQGSIVISDRPKNVILKSGKENLEDAYLYFINKEAI